MTNKERTLRLISRQEVDYLPSQITFSDRTRDKEISNALGLASADDLDGFLNNHIQISLTCHDTSVFFRNDEALMLDLQARGYLGVDLEDGIVYDSWGTGIKMHIDGFFIPFGCFMGDKQKNARAEKFLPPDFDRGILHMDLEDAIRHYKTPDMRKAGNFDPIAADLKKYTGGEFLVLPSGYFGIGERALAMLGWEQYMLELALRPKLIGELMDKITDCKIEDAKAKVALGIQVAHHGEDLGIQNTTFFSRKMFQEIYKPRLARLFKVYKDAGLPVVMHSCGCITEFLPDLIEIGLDILEPVQPCMDLEFIKKEYGKDLIFWGGINTQDLPYMTPEQVKTMVTKTIRTLGKGGGHIIGPSQEIMNDVPLENIKAMVETIVSEREKILKS